MKKLFCLLLVLLFVPVVSFAENTDPIVGCWYLYYDKSVTPEMESAFPDTDKMISIYLFSDSGIIYIANISVLGSVGTPEFSSGGKWVKTDDCYMISLIGFSENAVSYCENDFLFINTDSSTNYYMKLRKLYTFNPYQDIAIRK